MRAVGRLLTERSTRALNAGNDALAARLAEACIGMGKKITQSESLITVMVLRSVHSYGIDALLDVARYREDEDLAKQMFYERCASWLLHRECEKTPTPECDRMLTLSCKVLFPVVATLMKARLIPAPAIYLAGSVLSFYLVTLAVAYLLAACILRATRSQVTGRGFSQPREGGLVLALVFLAVAMLHAAFLTKSPALVIILSSSVLFTTCTWLAGRDASARLRPFLWLTLIPWLLIAPLTGRYGAYVEGLPDRVQNEANRLRPLPTANRETYGEARNATIEPSGAERKAGINWASCSSPLSLTGSTTCRRELRYVCGLSGETGLPPTSASDPTRAFLTRVHFDDLSVYAGLGDCCTPDITLDAARHYIEGKLRPSGTSVSYPDEYGQMTTAKSIRHTSDLRNVVVECLDERSIPLLTEGPASKDDVMRRFCVEALGKIGSAKGREHVLTAREDSDAIARERVLGHRAHLWRGGHRPVGAHGERSEPTRPLCRAVHKGGRELVAGARRANLDFGQERRDNGWRSCPGNYRIPDRDRGAPRWVRVRCRCPMPCSTRSSVVWWRWPIRTRSSCSAPRRGGRCRRTATRICWWLRMMSRADEGWRDRYTRTSLESGCRWMLSSRPKRTSRPAKTRWARSFAQQ